MPALRLILGDQLSPSIATLADCDRQADTILLCEVMAEASYVRHHQQKIALLFSAMRHFAEELRADGYQVRYVRLDDPANSGTLGGEVQRALSDTGADRVVLTEPGEYRVLEMMQHWRDAFGVPVEIRVDDRFLCTTGEFRRWAAGRTQFRMEYFYREMRRRHRILLQPDGAPVGGQWNFDKDNRKPPKAGMLVPARPTCARSDITNDVLALVAQRFGDNFGRLETFAYAVTRAQALAELDHFVDHLLAHFGDYQDAMVTGEPFLYHSVLSAYLNAGLLLPLEVCRRAEEAYLAGRVPLNAAEGFIRQILGWREYVRGLYWLKMPEYADLNHFDATTPLPWFYWSGETGMHCLRQAIGHSRDHAYSHHIQRLMVTGNFALLAGLDVKQVCDWYLAVYADAYEWVELPNTLGMALFADGGIMASKPYAASGNYINKMSNSCGGCRYDPAQTVGDTACPFNALYWDFLVRHEDKLRPNQRMGYSYVNWDRFAPDKQQAIRRQASRTLARMTEGQL